MDICKINPHICLKSKHDENMLKYVDKCFLCSQISCELLGNLLRNIVLEYDNGGAKVKLNPHGSS